MWKTLFFSYKSRLRCRFYVMRISGQGGCNKGSRLVAINSTLDVTTFMGFFLCLFLVNYAQSISLSVIIHFFINSCIFLTIFHHSSCSYGNTFSNIHSLRVTTLLQVKDNWMGQPTSVPYFLLGKCASNWPTSLIANYFNIKKIFAWSCIYDQSKVIYTT